MIKPLQDYILVAPIEQERVSAFGIILEGAADTEKTSMGNVVAVGPGRETADGKTLPVYVAVDDKVLFSKYAVTDVTLDGVKYQLLSARDVYGIIT